VDRLSHLLLSLVWFHAVMARAKQGRSSGSAGNEQLTAVVAAVLILLLAIEGATLLQLGPLLTVHAFVGMLLIPVVALKLASTGWRMLRYYRGDEEYVRRGPPHIALRVLVAPVTILSTVVLFATGVALLVLDQTHGLVVTLHQASFIVFVSALGVHVLTRALKLPQMLRTRVAGLASRISLVAGVLAAGALLATVTLPQADRLQDQATAHVGLDAR
jgi:hypothetical protein